MTSLAITYVAVRNRLSKPKSSSIPHVTTHR
jgi:hypothetical protein